MAPTVLVGFIRRSAGRAFCPREPSQASGQFGHARSQCSSH
ncbi:hypothetical protein E1H18_1417 [Caulobacter sp. RHG1]|nr:hypothetical protein [Caulobacter sp. RHG1]